jgi:hypothetical protein
MTDVMTSQNIDLPSWDSLCENLSHVQVVLEFFIMST